MSILPHCSLLHFGTEQQISEEENMAEFTRTFRDFHQETILHQLTSLQCTRTPVSPYKHEHMHTILHISIAKE